MQKLNTFVISAELDQAENVEGYCVADYFDCDLRAAYATREDAQAAAVASYKGADVDGVGCKWTIEAESSL